MRDGANWYVYCENSPLSYYDPNGLKKISWEFLKYYREDVSRTIYTSPDRLKQDSLSDKWRQNIEKGNEDFLFYSQLGLIGLGVQAAREGSMFGVYVAGGVETLILIGTYPKESRLKDIKSAVDSYSFTLIKDVTEYSSHKVTGYTGTGEKIWSLTSLKEVIRYYLEVDGKKYTINEDIYNVLLENSEGGNTIVEE